MGRARRPVHARHPDGDPEAAPQVGRPAGGRDRTRRRLPDRLTIRTRLTLVYSGLFLVAGILLLGATYVLVSRQPPFQMSTSVSGGPENIGTFHSVAEDTWQDASTALLTTGTVVLLIVTVVATAFGWLLAGRMLRPLHRITETARRITEAPAADRGLHERIALAGPADELTELADTFDRMLARLDHAFDGQRRFIANASHELRTPLTVNRSLLEVAMKRAVVTPEQRVLGETLLEMNARQERLLDGLLLLARAEREVTERSYVDLADVVEHVVDRTDSGRVSVTADPDEAPTTGHPALLERLVQNLVDNGVRYNVDAGGWVRVSSATHADRTVTVTVSNTGPVISRYELTTLFEPFVRGRTRTGDGTGLGLSIVRAVARAHGGEAAADPRDGGGLTVTVTLPAVH